MSRIIKINNFIILCNFKCGYSSFSAIKDKIIEPKVKKSDKIIFVYRNLFNRNISVFLNWCYRKNKIDDSWLLVNMQEKLNSVQFDNFMKLKNSNLVEAYKIFLNNLHLINFKNAHLAEQCKIVNKLNSKKKISYFINIDDQNNVQMLSDLISTKLECYNKSDDNTKKILISFLDNNEVYKNVIKNRYKNDIIYFNNFNIDICN